MHDAFATNYNTLTVNEPIKISLCAAPPVGQPHAILALSNRCVIIINYYLCMIHYYPCMIHSPLMTMYVWLMNPSRSVFARRRR